ncbi:6708_t:CDS:2, partial [Ambispora gerdemannii]
MYKPVSNYNGNKTSICSQVEAGKIIVDNLYCCAKDNKNCSLSSSDCVGNNYEVAQCHNLYNLDACTRTDLTITAFSKLLNGCTPTGTVADFACENLFQSEHRCNWQNITNGQMLASIPRNPVVELCGPAIIGLAIGMGVLGIIAIVLAFFIYKLRRRDPVIIPDN